VSLLCIYSFICKFFFFSSKRGNTSFSRDWSSDVCSSDLSLNPARCLNILRQRAGFNEGENRTPVYYRTENVPAGTVSSTKNEMIVTEAAFTPGTTQAAAEMYPPSANSMAQCFIHFILNERSRELLGEFHRWEDLSRTKTLVVSGRQVNPEEATNVLEKHLLRPSPQSFLDAVQRVGASLTSGEIQAMQICGW